MPVKKRRSTPRRKTVENTDEAYKAWIRTLPCVVCAPDWYRASEAVWTALNRFQARFNELYPGSCVSEAAHVGARGLSQKCSDRETIPLCAEHHREGSHSHHKLQKRFWGFHGIDKALLVKRLQEAYDAERGGGK